jgi:hypothetical protein
MKLFTDLKLNFCIPTASLLLLASFDASAQAQPPGGWGEPLPSRQQQPITRPNPLQPNQQQPIQQQPITRPNPQQPIQQQPIQQQPITRPNPQQPIQQQPIQQQPIQQQPNLTFPNQLQPYLQQPNQQQPINSNVANTIAILNETVEKLTRQNQRMIESAMRYGACLEGSNTQLINFVQDEIYRESQLSSKITIDTLVRPTQARDRRHNDCHRQFTDSFK